MTKHQIWFRRLILGDILLFIIMMSIELSPLTPSYSEFDFVLEKGLIGNFLSGENEIHLLIYFVILVSAIIVSWILLYRFHWTGRVLFVANIVLMFVADILLGDSIENGLVNAVESLQLVLEGAMVYMMFFTDLKILFKQKNIVPLTIERP
jgi:hypothetical protein